MKAMSVLLACVLVFTLAAPTRARLPWTESDVDLSLNSFYGAKYTVHWYWALGGAVVGGVLVVVTGGAAAPGIVPSIGTWIGSTAGLSGTAATNYGLALLGGGAVTSGGFGVLGGTVVLTATLEFGTNVAFDLAAATALSHFEERQFLKNTSTMLLPPDFKRDDGGKQYKRLLKRVDEHYYVDHPYYDPINQEVYKEALNYETTSPPADSKIGLNDRLRAATLATLLRLRLQHYVAARDSARSILRQVVAAETRKKKELVTSKLEDPVAVAISPQFVDKSSKRYVMPLMLWALAETGVEDADLDRVAAATSTIFVLEPDSPVIPVFVSGVTNRFLIRQDKLEPRLLKYIYEGIVDNVHDSKKRLPSLQTVLIRTLTMLRVSKDIVDNSERLSATSEATKKEWITLARRSADHYSAYEALAREILDSLNDDKNFMKDDGNRRNLGQMKDLVAKYGDAQAELQRRAEELE